MKLFLFTEVQSGHGVSKGALWQGTGAVVVVVKHKTRNYIYLPGNNVTCLM